MQRAKRLLAFSVPALLLLGGLSGWAGRIMSPGRGAQEEPHKPPEEDPTSPANYLWEARQARADQGRASCGDRARRAFSR